MPRASLRSYDSAAHISSLSVSLLLSDSLSATASPPALGAVLQGQATLIIDTRARVEGFVDETGRHQLQRQGAISATTRQADNSVGVVLPGATLLLNVGAGAPRDRADPVRGMIMPGAG